MTPGKNNCHSWREGVWYITELILYDVGGMTTTKDIHSNYAFREWATDKGEVHGPNEPTMNQIWAQGQLLGCATCVIAQEPHA